MNPAFQRLVAIGNRIVAELRRLSDAVQQQVETDRERQRAEQEKPCPPEVAGIRDAIQSIAESQKAAHTPKKLHKDRMFWVSAVGTTVVLFYTIFTYNMWQDANKNFRVGQRPWIKVGLVGGGFPEYSAPDMTGRPIVLTLKFTNVGQTPARDVNAASFVEVVDRDKPPMLIPADTINPRCLIPGRTFFPREFGMVFPNDKPMTDDVHRWKTVSGWKFTDEVLTETERLDLITGKKYLAVWSVVTYRDIFGIQRWTAFCDWNTLGGPMAGGGACTDYNNADDN